MFSRLMTFSIAALVLAITVQAQNRGPAAAPAGRGQAPAAAPRATNIPRMPDGKPNMTGLWQALGTAYWDIRDHSAQNTPFYQLGATGAEPAGQPCAIPVRWNDSNCGRWPHRWDCPHRYRGPERARDRPQCRRHGLPGGRGDRPARHVHRRGRCGRLGGQFECDCLCARRGAPGGIQLLLARSCVRSDRPLRRVGHVRE